MKRMQYLLTVTVALSLGLSAVANADQRSGNRYRDDNRQQKAAPQHRQGKFQARRPAVQRKHQRRNHYRDNYRDQRRHRPRYRAYKWRYGQRNQWRAFQRYNYRYNHKQRQAGRDYYRRNSYRPGADNSDTIWLNGIGIRIAD